jgi:precorrin-6A/cobalt-precorrin-6A reductase
MVTRVLILGGTAEARELAAALVPRPELSVVSSLAGRVAQPRLPVGEVRIGGFGGVAGLTRWLIEHRIGAVIDATHPYAERMRASAVSAAGAIGAAHLRLERPGWTAGPGDRWHRVAGFAEAVELLPRLGKRVFISTGRQRLAAFAGLPDQWFLARVVDEPTAPLPANFTVIRGRGPYTTEGELALLTEYRIDVLVTKDSGGSLTEAKLVAARRLGVPVVMIDRPPPVPGAAAVATAAEAVHWLDERRQADG